MSPLDEAKSRTRRSSNSWSPSGKSMTAKALAHLIGRIGAWRIDFPGER